MSCSRLVASPRCLSELYPLNEFYMGKACALNISLRYFDNLSSIPFNLICNMATFGKNALTF